jgi:hypothetical protein
MDVKGAPRSPKREKGCALRRAAGCDRWCGVPLCAVCGCGRAVCAVVACRAVGVGSGGCVACASLEVRAACRAVRCAPRRSRLSVSLVSARGPSRSPGPGPGPVRSSAAARSRARRFWSTLGRMRLFSFTYSVDACANDSSRPTRPECWHPDRPRRHRCRCRCR